MMIGAGLVPCVGSILQIVVTGPLTAAWYGYFLRHIRGQSAAMEHCSRCSRRPTCFTWSAST